MGVVLLLAASCSLTGPDQVPELHDGAPDTVYATIEGSGNDSSTRVYLGEDIRLYWNADDRISYFDKETYNYQYRFSGNTGDRSGELKKVQTVFHTGQPLEHVCAIYPYDSRNAVDDGKDNYETMTAWFPAEQAYLEGSFGQGANVMVAKSEDSNLRFKNAGGYLCIKMYGENVSVATVSLKGNGNEPIAGKAYVRMDVGGTPETTMDGSAAGTVTVVCSDPVDLGPTAGEYTAFWFVIPPVTFNDGFTVTVQTKEGGSFEKSTAKSFDIKRNVITSMVPFEVL